MNEVYNIVNKIRYTYAIFENRYKSASIFGIDIKLYYIIIYNIIIYGSNEESSAYRFTYQ
jgi:hypothetical protein